MTQEKASKNGNALRTNQNTENAKIEFPVTFELKTVLDASSSDKDNKKELSIVFDKLKITYSYIGNKKSSKGTYVSYHYNVTLQNKPQLDKLYSELKNVPGLKFAL